MTDSHVAPRLRDSLEDVTKREHIKRLLLVEAERLYASALANQGAYSRASKMYAHAIEAAANKGNFTFLRQLAFMKRVPVTLDEFLDSPEFLGDIQEIWPALKDDIRAMNPDVFIGEEPVHEALLGGATGTGKTTLCYSTNAYQAYLFNCFNTPQRLYGLSPITPIVFMMQSVSQTITKRIFYRPFREMFTAMPFTQKWLQWDRRREAELMFENGLTIVPALANIEAILGQAIAGSMLDEVNFMRIIENSKQTAGSRGKGGLYDQATDVYTNITRRRQRSFQTKGYSMGVLCILSSTRYKNDFLDKRMDEVAKHNLSNILCLRRKQYEVVPQERFSGVKFQIVVGTDDHSTMVIEPHHVAGEDYPLNATIETVPVEYRERFLTDPDGALRDIVGIATDTIAPYIGQRHKITEAILRFKEQKLKPICVKDFVELAVHGMPQWDDVVLNGMSPSLRKQPRFAHIDLSINGDTCGVSVVRLAGFENRASKEGVMEVLPVFVVEAAVAIKPSTSKELDIAEVRRWVLQLSTFYGLNLYSVTFDGFQSVESRQALNKSAVRTWLVSMDRNTEPYDELKRSLYEDRLMMGPFEHLRVELSQLEYNSKLRKVDHPPKGSKDVSDAVAGAVFAARSSRIVRAQAGLVDSQGEAIRQSSARPDPGPRPK